MAQSSDSTGQTQGDRLFVALELSEEIKKRLLSLQPLIPCLKWTPAANLHLTLTFIGQVTEDRTELIRRSLCGVSGSSFRLTVAGLGLFRRETGGILWAGVNAPPALEKLKRQADEALQLSAGLNMSKKGYSPHITLSRLKKPASEPLKNLVQEKSAELFGEVIITEFILFRSFLRPSGAVHNPVERYRLIDL